MDVDDFSDDGFDDVPDNALQELERSAIQLTQAHVHARAHAKQQPLDQASWRPASKYGWEEEEEEDEDLDDTEVTNDVGLPIGASIGRPIVDNALQQRQREQTTRRPVPPMPNPRWNPTVNPSHKLAVHNGRPFSTSQNYHHQQPPAQAQAGHLPRPPFPSNRFPASQTPETGRTGQAGDLITALQQRVLALESALQSSRGETSIVRAKANKAQEEHVGQVARLKKLNAEQTDRQNRIVEAAVAAKKSANTELQFLQRDMREVRDRARRKDGGGGGGGRDRAHVTTPKKATGARSWGLADGFDDVDIAMSPSKGQGRGKTSTSVAANVGERTPSKGKRKRPPIDSPIAALDISTEGAALVACDAKLEAKDHDDRAAFRTVVVEAPTAPFEFLSIVLDHGSFHDQPPTFDVLSRFSFPSDPTGTSISAMIFEKLPMMGRPSQPMQLLVDFAEQILLLWRRCVDESLYEPVKLLVALVAFTFDIHTTSVAPLIMDTLVPVARSTIMAIAEARLRLPDGNLSHSNVAEDAYLAEHIDTTSVLSLLYACAVSCPMMPVDADNGGGGGGGGSEYTSARFWRLMSMDLVLLILTPKQQPSDVMSMLTLLTTSALASSIGPISDDCEPADIARAMIERVSAKLTEPARIVAMSQKQRRSIRLAALRTMIAFSGSAFGAVQLALHQNAIPRLVACLSAAIDELYDQPIPSNVLPPSSKPPTLALLSSCEPTTSADLYLVISQCVLLVHKLVTDADTANVVDVSQKLSTSYGGSQRYLLALGRLAFAEEDLVMEAGIQSEVVDAAHDLLELFVTPDEGEIISQAFGA